jgi:hypothetical protein
MIRNIDMYQTKKSGPAAPRLAEGAQPPGRVAAGRAEIYFAPGSYPCYVTSPPPALIAAKSSGWKSICPRGFPRSLPGTARCAAVPWRLRCRRDRKGSRACACAPRMSPADRKPVVYGPLTAPRPVTRIIPFLEPYRTFPIALSYLSFRFVIRLFYAWKIFRRPLYTSEVEQLACPRPLGP